MPPDAYYPLHQLPYHVSPRPSLDMAYALPYTPVRYDHRAFVTPDSYGSGDDGWGDKRRDTDDYERVDSPRKKPRITLPRGHACVACSKCQEGIRPCATCIKANIECKDEDIPRKKPRNVLLEERILELESMLGIRKGSSARPSISTSSFSTDSGPSSDFMAGEPLYSGPSRISTPYVGSQPLIMPPPLSSASPHMELDIIPGSSIELALIQYILPYTPHLLIPVHPERLLAELSLSSHDPSRPHPALLYVLFSEAVRHLEAGIPPTSLPKPPYLFHPSLTPPIPSTGINRDSLLAHLGGTAPLLLERARHELDVGIRQFGRVFDLSRAAVGIARSLYTQGRFVEGWSIPVANLAIACGLHRISGGYIPPPPSIPPATKIASIPDPYAREHEYSHAHTYGRPQVGQPQLRMKVVLVPPARDEIEVAERVMTFWAVKRQCWTMSIGWGWPDPLPDEECTTEWPWGWGHVELGQAGVANERYSLMDLFDPSSAMHTSTQADTTCTLATKSTALLARASSLSDLPHSQRTVALPDGTVVATYMAPMPEIKDLQTAIALFRQHIPAPFTFPPSPASSAPLSGPSTTPPSPTAYPDIYDGPSDPFWILLHTNLYTAEMLMWWEMANHQTEAHRSAVQCARAIIGLVVLVPDEKWANVDVLSALGLSYAARVLNKEAYLLQAAGSIERAERAISDSEVLRHCLEGPINKYLKVAGAFSQIVNRIKAGQSEKVGEYERV
ncbi:hypothetical protein L198_00830 [Cryptococcus wingfieldii CBS 7118]|uniref:Zn(2)-C6 fungal-type domain-containing protein n=1 Tax=Cryptococcus wingfieldii CBS 7118 TaxID=1295528 RepID=A0A1E3K2L9_9TREE|nr:hypothetical protein L198_00830 [Cryptococcus wingfieldii CBS 7118]ODO07251.1 hypothetical protein L198_00830 [Cryptococcus wingfieldii CBS 7118]